MCNCLESISKQSGDIAKEKAEKTSQVFEYSNEQGFLDNQGFSFGADGGTILFMKYYIKYFLKKKNGSRAERVTTKMVSVIFTFCPFCGVKYAK